MKSIKLMILSLVLLVEVGLAQSNIYLAKTTILDSFEIIEDGNSRMRRFDLNEKISKFSFKCKSPEKTHIIMYCQVCPEPPTIKLYGKKESAYTKWIPLEHGQKISLAQCFESYSEKKGPWESALEGIYSVWQSFKNDCVERILIPALKGAKEVEPEDPKLDFMKTDYHEYLKLEDFAVKFRGLETYPLKSIYIISYEGELVFHAGDRSILEELYEVPGEASPAISKVLNIEGIKEDEETTYELNWDGIQPHLLSKLKTGEFYQIGVELENDTSDHNPYLFNFKVITKEELEILLQLFKHD